MRLHPVDIVLLAAVTLVACVSAATESDSMSRSKCPLAYEWGGMDVERSLRSKTEQQATDREERMANEVKVGEVVAKVADFTGIAKGAAGAEAAQVAKVAGIVEGKEVAKVVHAAETVSLSQTENHVFRTIRDRMRENFIKHPSMDQAAYEQEVSNWLAVNFVQKFQEKSANRLQIVLSRLVMSDSARMSVTNTVSTRAHRGAILATTTGVTHILPENVNLVSTRAKLADSNAAFYAYVDKKSDPYSAALSVVYTHLRRQLEKEFPHEGFSPKPTGLYTGTVSLSETEKDLLGRMQELANKNVVSRTPEEDAAYQKELYDLSKQFYANRKEAKKLEVANKPKRDTDEQRVSEGPQELGRNSVGTQARGGAPPEATTGTTLDILPEKVDVVSTEAKNTEGDTNAAFYAYVDKMTDPFSIIFSSIATKFRLRLEEKIFRTDHVSKPSDFGTMKVWHPRTDDDWFQLLQEFSIMAKKATNPENAAVYEGIVQDINRSYITYTYDAILEEIVNELKLHLQGLRVSVEKTAAEINNQLSPSVTAHTTHDFSEVTPQITSKAESLDASTTVAGAVPLPYGDNTRGVDAVEREVENLPSVVRMDRDANVVPISKRLVLTGDEVKVENGDSPQTVSSAHDPVTTTGESAILHPDESTIKNTGDKKNNHVATNAEALLPGLASLTKPTVAVDNLASRRFRSE